MRTKLDAARIATASGVPVVIARFRLGALKRVLSGEPVGTLFHANAVEAHVAQGVDRLRDDAVADA